MSSGWTGDLREYLARSMAAAPKAPAVPKPASPMVSQAVGLQVAPVLSTSTNSECSGGSASTSPGASLTQPSEPTVSLTWSQLQALMAVPRVSANTMPANPAPPSLSVATALSRQLMANPQLQVASFEDAKSVGEPWPWPIR